MSYTQLHCVIDSHIQPDNEDEEEYLKSMLLDLVRDKLNSVAGYNYVLKPHIEPPGKILAVTMLSIGAETGDKFSRVHIHFVLEVKHNSKFLLNAADGLNIYERLYEWITPRLPWSTKPYVSVRLLDTRAQNYVAKSERFSKEVDESDYVQDLRDNRIPNDE